MESGLSQNIQGQEFFGQPTQPLVVERRDGRRELMSSDLSPEVEIESRSKVVPNSPIPEIHYYNYFNDGLVELTKFITENKDKSNEDILKKLNDATYINNFKYLFLVLDNDSGLYLQLNDYVDLKFTLTNNTDKKNELTTFEQTFNTTCESFFKEISDINVNQEILKIAINTFINNVVFFNTSTIFTNRLFDQDFIFAIFINNLFNTIYNMKLYNDNNAKEYNKTFLIFHYSLQTVLQINIFIDLLYLYALKSYFRYNRNPKEKNTYLLETFINFATVKLRSNPTFLDQFDKLVSDSDQNVKQKFKDYIKQSSQIRQIPNTILTPINDPENKDLTIICKIQNINEIWRIIIKGEVVDVDNLSYKIKNVARTVRRKMTKKNLGAVAAAAAAAGLGYYNRTPIYNMIGPALQKMPLVGSYLPQSVAQIAAEEAARRAAEEAAKQSALMSLGALASENVQTTVGAINGRLGSFFANLRGTIQQALIDPIISRMPVVSDEMRALLMTYGRYAAAGVAITAFASGIYLIATKFAAQAVTLQSKAEKIIIIIDKIVDSGAITDGQKKKLVGSIDNLIVDLRKSADTVKSGKVQMTLPTGENMIADPIESIIAELMITREQLANTTVMTADALAILQGKIKGSVDSIKSLQIVAETVQTDAKQVVMATQQPSEVVTKRAPRRRSASDQNETKRARRRGK